MARVTLGEVAREARGRCYKGSRDPSLDQRLDLVVAFFGSTASLESITTLRLHAFVTHLEKRKSRQGGPLSGKTINRYLSVVSGLLDYARSVLYTTNRPNIPWQQETKGRQRTLTPEQEQALCAAMRPDYALCVRVFTSTGLRPGKEFFELRVEQVELEWLRLGRTKTQDLANVPIEPALSRQLRALIERGAMPSADAFYREFQRAKRACRLSDDLCPYSLRHTVGTRLARELPGPLVQSFMRHADYRTTEQYIHFEDADKLRAAAVLRPAGLRVVAQQ